MIALIRMCWSRKVNAPVCTGENDLSSSEKVEQSSVDNSTEPKIHFYYTPGCGINNELINLIYRPNEGEVEQTNCT